jgi:Cu/Ag efflux protein CusF
MRRFVVPAAFLAAVAATSIAYAAQAQLTTGTIKAFDPAARTVTLQTGVVYYLPAGWKDPGLKSGERVQISFDMHEGKHMAESVTILK